MIDVSRHRKVIAWVVSLTTVLALRRMGLEPGDLSAFGIDSDQLQQEIVDNFVTIVIPGVLGWAFPNRPVDGQENLPEERNMNIRLFILVGICIALVASIGALVAL